MSDLISRKWLMECVDEGWIRFDTEKDTNKFIHLVRDTAPSARPKSYREGYQAGFKDAQPERKRGKWIIKDNPAGWYRVTCSECEKDVTSTAPCIGFYPNAKVTWDYCPNCGADMRGEQE